MTTYTKSQAYNKIVKLVDGFRTNEPNLLNVSEAQIEQNYIRKLFHYLNWNVDNTGLPVSQWEFILQKNDPAGKRPDYIVQLDGQHLLVMDAKKVKYDLHDPRWMQQVYAYAYSTQNQPTPRKIDFALLTDFQEFILLDCTLYAANSKTVGNFCILDWTCDDYVSQFDTLWELFERENIRAALHTRATENPAGLWARYLSPKKVKANRIPPDKAFLSEMDDEKTGWRVRLAKDMKKRNPAADGALITAAVQLLIDRLIFVKALSDREIEDDYLTQLAERVEQSGLAADDAGWFNACRDIFSKLNQFYNGSVFESRPELEAVTVSNKVVREVIRDLQPENSPYNFAVLPVEILGTIYERFLGRVVRATDSRVKIEDKPEVRKAGGVYYTPQYIVDYIVQNTVGTLLAACQTPADVAKLRILDPACGSGSFLLGAYAALIRWHEAYYGDKERLTKQDREAAYYESNGGVHLRQVRLTAKLKRSILLNNIFGVDIDAQAVEVTRFSLSLKALENTRREELREEVNLFKQTILPDLSQNIKCGNSLIGSDYFTDQLLLDPDELKRVNPFDWQRELPQVFGPLPASPVRKPSRTGEEPAPAPVEIFSSTGAGRGGGVDVIIGNPPYGAYLHEADKEYLTSKFKYQSYQLDSYLLFLEQSTRLLSKRGLYGMIIPNPWLTNLSQTNIRKFVTANVSLEAIVHFRFPVFQKVTVDTEIVIFKNTPPTNQRVTVSIVESLDSFRTSDTGVKQISHEQEKWQALDGNVINIFTNPAEEALALKCAQVGTSLESLFMINVGIKPYQVGKGKPPQTRDVVENRPYDSNRRVNASYRPYLRGSDIGRYKIEPLESRYLKYGAWLAEPRPAANFDAPIKIFMRQTGDSLVATTDHQQYLCLNNMHVLVPEENLPANVSYILGIINSSLLNWYYHTLNPEVGEALAEVKKTHVAKLPIRSIDFNNAADKAAHDRMVKLVDTMRQLHSRLASANVAHDREILQRQIDATDREIDALVYELYGLTPNEIATIKGQP